LPTTTDLDVARKGQEAWRNHTAGTVFVRRLDHRGDFNRHEEVGSGRVCHISPEERRMNSEMAASEELDMFRNGTLQPLRLLDTSDEARELASNPNVMSEADMRALVKGHHKTFESRLGSIRSLSALQRLRAIAHDEDAPVKRVEAIEARIRQVQPGMAQRPAPSAASAGDGRMSFGRPVTPR
jgi:hypothetical protein